MMFMSHRKAAGQGSRLRPTDLAFYGGTTLKTVNDSFQARNKKDYCSTSTGLENREVTQTVAL